MAIIVADAKAAGNDWVDYPFMWRGPYDTYIRRYDKVDVSLRDGTITPAVTSTADAWSKRLHEVTLKAV